MEYLVTFVEGLASFISPCILPIIPVYISYFAANDNSFKKSIINSIGFVLGFSIVFILLGVFAGTFGKLVYEYSSFINIILGIILIVIGLNYMGVIFVKFLNKTKGIDKRYENLNFVTTLFFGMFFSLTWSPCVGAFLSSALMLASTTGSVFKGAFLLFLYSLGLGIPFIVTTLFMEKIKSTFDFIKKNYNIINRVSGGFLVLVGGFSITQELISMLG